MPTNSLQCLVSGLRAEVMVPSEGFGSASLGGLLSLLTECVIYWTGMLATLVPNIQSKSTFYLRFPHCPAATPTCMQHTNAKYGKPSL